MFLSYIKYRFSSQGKFRLHSPFVYDLYEEVLDKMTRENWREELNDKLNFFLMNKKDVFHKNDVVIIKYDMHRSKENEREWNEMINDDSTDLSIDCYRFGLLFKMERKEKQHFILKF
ncbi:MAG: hypothetical protein E7066_02660 [Lentimicrobiaceae bacterium]|nr:hypothetical protein [Lentimicrobiaceae bacterium]